MQRTRWILAAAIAAVLCGSPALAAPAAHGADIGIDLAGVDHAVKPGDNFFDYAYGKWLATAKIPADRSSTGTFLKIFELTEKHTADLIQNAGKSHPAAGSNARKIADYYAAFMDEAAIAKHGLAPLKPEL
ncbi:MAG TPA: M13 family peptidase, partial [Rhodanobacter sp.]